MNPFTQNKLLSCYNEIKQIKQGKIPVPRTVEFFISNKCQHACQDCHSTSLHNIQPHFIDTKKTKEILSELKELGVEGLEISGGGEPLLHPDFIEIIKDAKIKGFKLGLFTNGIHLDNQLSELILQNFLFVRIALDSATSTTYLKVHNADDFKKLVKKIKQLISLKKQMGSQTTIGLKFLISKLNAHEVDLTIQLAEKIGSDYLQFKSLRNSIQELEADQAKLIQTKIDDAKKTSSINLFGSLIKSNIDEPCSLNPLHPLINATGDIFLCAFFQHRKDSHAIGNIHNESFKKIWFGNKHKEAIRNLKIEECNIYDCPFHRLQNYYKQHIEPNKSHFEFI